MRVLIIWRLGAVGRTDKVNPRLSFDNCTSYIVIVRSYKRSNPVFLPALSVTVSNRLQMDFLQIYIMPGFWISTSWRHTRIQTTVVWPYEGSNLLVSNSTLASISSFYNACMISLHQFMADNESYIREERRRDQLFIER